MKSGDFPLDSEIKCDRYSYILSVQHVVVYYLVIM